MTTRLPTAPGLFEPARTSTILVATPRSVLFTTSVNERLRSAMLEQDKGPDDVAAACRVDPKTAARWISPGRTPHPRHRHAIATLLKVNEDHLWPDVSQSSSPTRQAKSDLLGVYPDRSSVPREAWIRNLNEARTKIDVLIFSGTFFAQTNPRVAKMLAESAAAGTSVRLCFGNPSGSAVATRDREEGLQNTLAAKIRASLTYYRELVGKPGCEIRLHDTTLYASIFRFDDRMLVNPHIWGQPASANPVIHLQRLGDTGWFDRYMDSFDAVWKTASPWIPPEE